MIRRLTIQHAGTAFRATISKRENGSGAPIGHPEVFVVDDKDDAKNRAKVMARGLGLKTYRVLDKTLKI